MELATTATAVGATAASQWACPFMFFVVSLPEQYLQCMLPGCGLKNPAGHAMQFSPCTEKVPGGQKTHCRMPLSKALPGWHT